MMKNKIFLSIISLMFLAFQCETSDIQKIDGAVILTLETYDSLRNVATIDTVFLTKTETIIDTQYIMINNVDTIEIIDTTYITNIDTLVRIQYLTDTLYVTNVDTMYLTEYIIDTVETIKTITIIDTLYKTRVILDTVYLDKIIYVDNSKENFYLYPDTVRADVVYVGGNNTIGGPELLFDGIPYVSLWANAETKELILSNGNPSRGTRWANNGYPHQLFFAWDSLVYIDSIYFNVFGWPENYTHEIKVWSWGDSLSHFTTEPIMYSGHELKITTSNLYIEFLGGNNAWCDLAEIVIKGN